MLLRRAAMALLVLAGAAVPALDWLRLPEVHPPPRQVALERFLTTAVAPVTRTGHTVALVIGPAPEAAVDLRDSGYLRYRAQYLLPGRHVILGDDGRANVVASFPSGAIRRR